MSDRDVEDIVPASFEHVCLAAGRVPSDIEKRRTASGVEIGAQGVAALDHTGGADWQALRAKDVTASVAGALFGVHPYVTPLALWHTKSGLAPAGDQVETKAMRRGRLLEPAAIQALREERPTWQVMHPLGVYLRLVDDRIGATPDAIAVDPERAGFGVVQVKTVSPMAFNKSWRDDDGAVAAPLWVALQAIIEAKLSGASWACVVALRTDYGLDLDVIDVPIHDGAWASLREQAREFWRRVDKGDPYPADYGRDGEILAALNPVDPTADAVDLSGNNRIAELCDRRAALKAREKDGDAANKERKVLDVEICDIMGAAPAARLADGRVILRKTVSRKGHVVQPSTYETITVKGEAA